MPSQSVRFDADNEEYTVTLSPALGTTITIVTWFRLAVDRDAYTTAWCLDNGSTDTAAALQTDSGGTIMRLVDDSTTQDLITMTVGTWYCFGVVRSALSGATALRALYGTNPASLSVFTGAPGGSWDTANFNRLRIAESQWNNEWLNGNIAFTKVWTRVLTDQEIADELSQYLPKSTTNLYAAWSFWDGPSTTDRSGNGHTLTGGSNTATESGPAGIVLGGGPEGGRGMLLT